MTAQTTVAKPVVFVSSTVDDLQDLRSALKSWLDEMGFDVQMSEYNDFRRRPEVGAFESCFETIRQSHYYVLIIGDRRGAWYRRKDGVSVTQQEYRVAYQSWLAMGRPVPLLFARSRTMTALRERKLSRPPKGSRSILQDPVFTSRFVDEVVRQRDTREAVEGRGPYPSANFLTNFSSFSDLTNTLKTTLRISGPISTVVIRENLRHELEHNLRMLLSKNREQPFFLHWFLGSVRDDLQIDMQQAGGKVTISKDQMKYLSMYSSVGTTPPESLNRSALDDAIRSGAFLEFDTATGSLVVTPLLRALYQFREELDVYDKRYSAITEQPGKWLSLWDQVRNRPSAEIDVPGWELVSLYSIYDSQVNLVRLLVSILRYLYGHTSRIDVNLLPTTPISGEAEKIEQERVSEEELKSWLVLDHLILRGSTGEVVAGEDSERALNTLARVKESMGAGNMERVIRERMDYLPKAYVDQFVEGLFAQIESDRKFGGS